MKQILTTAFALFCTILAISQQPNPYPRTIQVAGSAEIDITTTHGGEKEKIKTSCILPFHMK